MFDIFSLESSVKAKLETITRFVSVLDTYALQSDGYPFVSFEMGDFKGIKADTCSNLRDVTFNAIILQVVNDDVSRSLAKSIIYKCLNDVINAFDSDLTLGNSDIINQKVIAGDLGTITGPQGDSLSLTFSISLEVNNSII